MLIVETIGKIRRYHFVDGKGIKEISRLLGVCRNTVRKVIRNSHDAPADGIHILKTHLCDTGEDEAVSLVSFYRTAPFSTISLFLLVYNVALNKKFT